MTPEKFEGALNLQKSFTEFASSNMDYDKVSTARLTEPVNKRERK
jgi:hypothetical protein